MVSPGYRKFLKCTAADLKISMKWLLSSSSRANRGIGTGKVEIELKYIHVFVRGY
jgi:hypothetical protein